MADGVKKLRKLQIGKESVSGTEVNAFILWRGTGGMTDNGVAELPEEDLGYLTHANRVYFPTEGGTVTFDSVPMSYEHGPIPFEFAFGAATPTADGTGFTRTYDVPSTAISTSTTATLEFGDNEAAEIGLYGYTRSITLEGAGGGPLMMGFEMGCREIATTTFTSLTPATVEVISFGNSGGGIFIDNDATGFASPPGGGTQKAKTLLAATINIDPGWREKFSIDRKDMTWTAQTAPVVSGSFTYEHNTIAVAEKALWRAGTTRYVELYFKGTTATTGTTYTVNTLLIQMVLKYTSFDTLSDQNGNDTIVANWTCVDNGTNPPARFLFASVDGNLWA